MAKMQAPNEEKTTKVVFDGTLGVTSFSSTLLGAVCTGDQPLRTTPPKQAA
jgi:hypothetical protein